MDTVSDLARCALALELWGYLSVEHDISCALGLATPSLVILESFSKGLDDLEHTRANLVAVDIDATFAQVSLDLIICQVSQGGFEILIKLLLKGLSKCSIISFDSILDELILINLAFKFHAVKFIFDVVLKLHVAVEN